MFLSFETVSMVNMIYLVLIFLGFIIPQIIYEQRNVLTLCLRYTVFMTVLRYVLGITLMVNDTWDCSVELENETTLEYSFGLFGLHISDHNRQILDAVGFHHDTCKVDRTLCSSANH